MGVTIVVALPAMKAFNDLYRVICGCVWYVWEGGDGQLRSSKYPYSAPPSPAVQNADIMLLIEG